MAKKNALPGFGLSLGVSVTLLTALVLLPLAALLLKSLHLSAAEWQALLQSERLQQALWVSFSTAAAAGVLSVLIGGLLAWMTLTGRP